MKKRIVFLIGLLLLLLAGGFVSDQKSWPTNQHQTTVPAMPAAIPGLAKDFGKIPIFFVPNQGQTDNAVNFYVRGTDKTVYFAPDGVTFSLSYSTVPKNMKETRRIWQDPRSPASKAAELYKDLKRWTVKMDFLGARKDARPEGLEETGAVISYFKGKPEEWKTGLQAYSKIRYRDLWPGIDLVYMGVVNKLKYEFIVHPGADPGQIRLACRGTERVEVTEEGRLRMTTPAGVFEDDNPVAYQEVEGKQRSVAMAYALKGPEGGETGEFTATSGGMPDGKTGSRKYVFGFEVGDYDPSRTLVLDPAVIVYCGYIGGSGQDIGMGIAVDAAGNAYVSGITYSTEATFPIKGGPDLTFNGIKDAFVAKVHSSGTSLVYCSYLGGSGGEDANGIAIDKSGNAYITGNTDSSEASFPVTVGPDLTYNGGSDVYLAKVNSSGTGLDYCGYIGGSDQDSWPKVAADGSGNAYLTGSTLSSQATFPVKIGPDLSYNGNMDTFVAKVSPSGQLVYCGYIGGSGRDEISSVALDNSGNVYVTGFTESSESTFPVLGGPDLVHNGGRDAFVSKVKSSGKALEYCGYIGGANDEIGYGIAVDSSGNAYVSGTTSSTEATFPVKGGPDLTFNGNLDGFVAKINSSAKALEYCGYIGGTNEDGAKALAIDGLGNAYVTGRAWSDESSFPVTSGPDLTHNSDSDGYVAKINAAGSGLVYCGYIGDAGCLDFCGIAVDSAGDAYITGYTGSAESNFPVTVGPDLTFNGDLDAFVAKVTASGVTFSLGASPSSATVNAGQSASYTITVMPEGGSFDSSVSFSCTGLPSKCTASFSPESVTPGSSAVTTTLTLATQATKAAGALVGSSGFVPPTLGLWLIILLLSLWFGLRVAAQAKPRRRWLAAGAIVCLIVLLARCGTKEDGNGNNPPPYTGTPKGTHQISVKGQSGSVIASTTVTLVVN